MVKLDSQKSLVNQVEVLAFAPAILVNPLHVRLWYFY